MCVDGREPEHHHHEMGVISLDSIKPHMPTLVDLCEVYTHVAVCSAIPADEIDCSFPSCTSKAACAAGRCDVDDSNSASPANEPARHEDGVVSLTILERVC